MPYFIDKKSKCVYKKKADGSKGAKVGCTRGDLQKYVSALHVNADEQKKILQEIKEAYKPFLKESETMIEAPIKLANNVEFYVVERSKDPMDDPMKLFYKSNPVDFANQVRGGFLPEDVYGFYMSEEEANNVAHDAVQAVYEAANNLEEKKSKVTERLTKKISKLQREADQHLKNAKQDPANADSHQEKAEGILARIKELRGKQSLVEKSKKPLAKKEEDTSKKKS